MDDAFDLGGWGLGVAIPNSREVVRLAMESLARGVPRFSENEGSKELRAATDFKSVFSDFSLPASWTDGSVKWHDLLARAHSFPCPIHIYEGQVLLRSLELACKRPEFRRGRLVVLEDNQVVCGSFSRGRSSRTNLNKLCRKKSALEVASGISLAVLW